MKSISKNIHTLTVGLLIMVVWVALWFIIDVYISNLYKQYGIMVPYVYLITATILLYYLSGESLKWIASYGV
tara:strand:- start:2000 stop:2215 length:216 start_codon:yes stop_codon:yes gene_type:complete